MLSRLPPPAMRCNAATGTGCHGRGYLFGLSDEETVEYTKENEKDELKVSESEEDYE